MKTLILVILVVIFVYSAVPVQAAQKYNSFSGEWETTSSDAELKYNSFDNKWSYEQPGSKLEYNAFENEWEWAPPSCESSHDE